MTIEQRVAVLEEIFAKLQDYYMSDYSGEEIDERLTAAHNAVRYDAAQTLTSEQKAQARNNISAMQGIESTDHPGCNYVLNGSTVEWVNPPMQLGVEYRTTERYLGKPVYCTLVNFGLLPNKGTKGLNFEEITNPEKIIRWSGSTSNGYALPGGNLYTGWDEIVVRIVANRIDVKTTTDESTYSATFVLWYTKTTD